MGGREGGRGTGELTGQLSGLQQFTSARGSNPTPPGGGGGGPVRPWLCSQLICSCCRDPDELFLHVSDVVSLWFGEPALNTFKLHLCPQSLQEFPTKSLSSCFGSTGPDQSTGLSVEQHGWKILEGLMLSDSNET